MNLPAAAAHCGMTNKEMKLTFWEYLKYNKPDYEISEDTPEYPGGKSRACTKLEQFIGDLRDYKEYREPFLGGGSVAIHITKKYPHLNVWVNDLYEPLYNFWRVLQDDGRALCKQLQELKSEHPDPDSALNLFLQAKDIVNDGTKSNTERATAFYML